MVAALVVAGAAVRRRRRRPEPSSDHGESVDRRDHPAQRRRRPRLDGRTDRRSTDGRRRPGRCRRALDRPSVAEPRADRARGPAGHRHALRRPSRPGTCAPSRRHDGDEPRRADPVLDLVRRDDHRAASGACSGIAFSDGRRHAVRQLHEPRRRHPDRRVRDGRRRGRPRQPARAARRSTQPFANHNGGKIVFGPDGLLWSAWATAAAAATPTTRPRTPTTCSGKLLRIDPTRTERRPRLRHPGRQPVRRRRTGAGDRRTAAQPVAVPLRPGHRRPLDRRRRPERHRGDRLPPGRTDRPAPTSGGAATRARSVSRREPGRRAAPRRRCSRCATTTAGAR